MSERAGRDRCSSFDASGRPRKILSRSLTETPVTRPNSSGEDKPLSTSAQFDYSLVEKYVKKSGSPVPQNIRRPSARSLRLSANGRKISLEVPDRPPEVLITGEPTAYVGPPARTRVSEDSSLCQVLEFLYISGLDAAFDAQRLCRQNIEWIVNASMAQRQGTPQSVRVNCPCICKAPTKHARNELAIHVNGDTSPQALVHCFEEVNKFITSARANRKQVLVFSDEGHNSAQALALQYIMYYHKQSYKKARSFMEGNLGFALEMSGNFEQAIQLWEKHLSTNVQPPSETILVQQKPGQKNAW